MGMRQDGFAVWFSHDHISGGMVENPVFLLNYLNDQLGDAATDRQSYQPLT
jgi:hypothetical protein